MSYTLRFSRRAANYLERLDRPTQQRMADAIRILRDDPLSPRNKQLSGLDGRRAIRVGGWRVIYSLDATANEVNIIEIGVRGQVYRDR